MILAFELPAPPTKYTPFELPSPTKYTPFELPPLEKDPLLDKDPLLPPLEDPLPSLPEDPLLPLDKNPPPEKDPPSPPPPPEHTVSLLISLDFFFSNEQIKAANASSVELMLAVCAIFLDI